MPEEERDFIVSNLGNLGRYQLFICLMIFLSKFPTGWVLISHVFLNHPIVNTWCVSPANITDACDDKCDKVEYNRTVFKETIKTEWDLICKDAPLASISQSIVMLGVSLGCIIFGSLSDKYGRRPIFIIACVCECFAGLIVSLSPYYWFFIIFRFLTAAFVGGTMVTSIVIIMEIIGPKYREAMSILYQIPFNCGHATLPLFAYYFRNWRHYNFCYSIFPAVYFIYICIIPESPRWLVSTGKTDEAAAVIEKAAKCSRMPLDNVRSDVDNAAAKVKAKGPIVKGKIADLFRTPYLRVKTIAMAFCWLVVCMVYYGLSQYTSTLSGDIFWNIALSASTGVPGTLICIPMTKFLGRNLTLIISNSLSGVSLLIFAIIPNLSATTRLILATLGLFGASVTFPNVYLYGAELFPTVVRNSGVGLCSFIGRVGSIFAPFISDTSSINMRLPPLIFGLFSIAAAFSCLFMPETKGYPLPETLEDGETFGKKKTSSE